MPLSAEAISYFDLAERNALIKSSPVMRESGRPTSLTPSLERRCGARRLLRRVGRCHVSVVLEQMVHALPKHELEATIQINNEDMAALVVEQSKEPRVAARPLQQLGTNIPRPQPHGSPVHQRSEPMQVLI